MVRRLTKAPKVYVRDNGICYAHLGIETMDELLGHACVDLRPDRKFAVHAGKEGFPLHKDIRAVTLPGMVELLARRDLQDHSAASSELDD